MSVCVWCRRGVTAPPGPSNCPHPNHGKAAALVQEAGLAPEAVGPDGTPAPGWIGLVAIDAHEGTVTAKWAVDDPEDGKIPTDSCMALDPAVTA